MVDGKKEISEKERRVRAITKVYYSNLKVQEALANFALHREAVPRYFEGFGKRPDTLHYPSDVLGLVQKGATSFHASEELWHDPLRLDSEMTQEQMQALRKGWDLLIDIDSPFLDCSRIAAKLILAALEHHGVKNRGLKFSGNRGWHIIISSKAFPRECGGFETKAMFPEWPRAISEYLMWYIRDAYQQQAAELLTNFSAIEQRTQVTRAELEEIRCKRCDHPAKKGIVVHFVCPVCNMHIQRRDVKITKRRLTCLNEKCAGVLEGERQEEYLSCEYCKDPENEKFPLTSLKYPEFFEKVKGVRAEKVAALDLVLVAPRHLFRMPYSLHEKTALVSSVLTKEQLSHFTPRDADPLKVKVLPFLPDNEEGEARQLLAAALDWKRTRVVSEESMQKKKYVYEKLDLQGVKEELFPAPLQKLLKGLKDGKKRGLFILITFLRSLGFSPESIQTRVREWNAKNDPPLKEGYLKSQLDWHFRQKKQILPPNYENPAFYRDLGLLDKKPDAKNPIVEVLRALRREKAKR